MGRLASPYARGPLSLPGGGIPHTILPTDGAASTSIGGFLLLSSVSVFFSKRTSSPSLKSGNSNQKYRKGVRCAVPREVPSRRDYPPLAPLVQIQTNLFGAFNLSAHAMASTSLASRLVVAAALRHRYHEVSRARRRRPSNACVCHPAVSLPGHASHSIYLISGVRGGGFSWGRLCRVFSCGGRRVVWCALARDRGMGWAAAAAVGAWGCCRGLLFCGVLSGGAPRGGVLSGCGGVRLGWCTIGQEGPSAAAGMGGVGSQLQHAPMQRGGARA